MESPRIVSIHGHDHGGSTPGAGAVEAEESRAAPPRQPDPSHPSRGAGHGQGRTPASAPGQRTLILRLGQRFDISALGLINRILRSPHTTSIGQIVLDLRATTMLFDSGLALLLMLHARAGPLRERIHLINCRPAVRRRLDESGVGALFERPPADDFLAHDPVSPRRDEIAWNDLAQAVQLLAFQDSALLCLDREQRVRFGNRGTERLLRRPAAEIIGQSCAALLRERVPGCLQMAFAQVSDGPLPNTVALHDCRLVAIGGDGSETPVEASLSHFRLCGEDGYALLLRDVSRQLEKEARLRHLSQHDPLTGLANRSLFIDRLDNAIKRHEREASAFALLFVDLNDFKAVNDAYGHDVGDALLRGFAQRLSACLRESDTVGRLGGDEFAVILEQVDERIAAQMLHDLANRLHQYPLLLNGRALHLRASIGLAVYPQHGTTAIELLRHADQAMYREKARARIAPLRSPARLDL